MLSHFYAQNNLIKVTFKVIAPNAADNVIIFISGNHSALGNWRPDKVPMSKNVQDNCWYYSIQIAAGYHLSYKFTQGSWDTEALNDDGSVPANENLTALRDTIILKHIHLWKIPGKEKSLSEINGVVKYHRNITGEGLEPRDLIVWLPPGYDQNENCRFPVLYMHDGQNIFDPVTAFAGIDWRIDETADNMIRNGKIVPLIIVGIYNTPRRNDEYSHTKTGKLYMNFILNTVKPLIDSKYRTLPDREYTVTAGSSLGGLVSFMLCWEHSDVFSKAACLSPAFKIETLNYVRFVERTDKPQKPIKVYIDNGMIGIENELQPGIEAMISALNKQGYLQDQDYFFYRDSVGTHNENSWGNRFWRPLKLFFGSNLILNRERKK